MKEDKTRTDYEDLMKEIAMQVGTDSTD